MSKFTTVLESESIEYDHPPVEPGKTVYYKDWNGNWFTAKFTCEDCPKGWGFASIEYSFDFQTIRKCVPCCCLYGLDAYLAQQPDYGQFEAADYPDDDSAYDSLKDDMAERAALHRLGCGA